MPDKFPTQPESLRRSRWLIVIVFAIAMAWVESSVVLYLRTMLDRLNPYQPEPLPVVGGFATAEIVREAATMVMLASVGWLAGWNRRSRLGYFLTAFGVWDLFYYVFLKVLTGWPHSLFDWDVLFLIPLPWWGPVLAPVLIALLMIVWGTLASQSGRARPLTLSNVTAWGLNFIGTGLALYVFMADALRVADRGAEVIRNVLPTRFDWPLFCLALLFMSAPALECVWAARFAGNTVPTASSAD